MRWETWSRRGQKENHGFPTITGTYDVGGMKHSENWNCPPMIRIWQRITRSLGTPTINHSSLPKDSTNLVKSGLLLWRQRKKDFPAFSIRTRKQREARRPEKCPFSTTVVASSMLTRTAFYRPSSPAKTRIIPSQNQSRTMKWKKLLANRRVAHRQYQVSPPLTLNLSSSLIKPTFTPFLILSRFLLLLSRLAAFICIFYL